MYDAENRRFAAADPIKGNITQPLSLVSYLYCVDNPLGWVDLLGLDSVWINGSKYPVYTVIGSTIGANDSNNQYVSLNMFRHLIEESHYPIFIDMYNYSNSFGQDLWRKDNKISCRRISQYDWIVVPWK